MSSRSSNPGKSIISKSDSQNIEKRLKINSSTPANNKQIKESPVARFKTGGTTIEVTVKTQDHIESPKMLNKQTRNTLRGIHQNPQTSRSQSSKTSRLCTSTQATDAKKQFDKSTSHKSYHPRIDKLIDTIPQKLPASSSSSASSNYSAIKVIDSSQPITVFDKGIQCGGIFDYSSGNLSIFNPVRTLGFLMKELELYVHDDKANKILTEMEQALLRIPTEPGKITPEDLEAITMRNNLEIITTKLAEKSKQMEKMYEALVKDKERLVQQTREQSYLLDQANRRENELEYLIKKLKCDLNDANNIIKNEQNNKKKINDLQDVIKKMELIQNQLKNDLHEQNENSQQAYFDVQYLKLEKEKLSAMSSFKDSQLIDHRKAIKSLQNLIHNQLLTLSKESSLDDKFDSNHDASTVIRGQGLASSSHVSPENSVPPVTWREGSQLSISSVNSKLDNKNDDDHADINELTLKPVPLKDESVQTLENLLNESGGERFKEKTHLEFTSFAGEEISHSTSAFIRNHDDTVYKNLDDIDKSNKRNSINYNIDKILSNIQTTLDEKKMKHKKKSPKKPTTNYRRLDNEKIFIDNYDDEKPRKDVQTIFENARINNKFNVRVPSPLRQYPDPNWTDSSLPTMSIAESNIV
ncbi:uncharacterized protein LOC122853123 isoform X2 [Aphidius gifuensis]|uniref:uncharacterized protein LOC122853123 isoform X2 n=1 Tax=Aphidius gifuensis TaxID=684658 RepID=UPI001CDB851A|nr:uncharacterized protein LOC122853123 isoform X2 [Aphidius gifuensis]